MKRVRTMKMAIRRGAPLSAILVVLVSLSSSARAVPLSLEEAIAIARFSQPRLRAADAQIKLTNARIGRAFAAYLPNLNLALVERWEGSNTAAVLGVDTKTGAASTTYPFGHGFLSTLSLALDERLFDFGRTGGVVAAARAAEQQARVDRSVLGLDIELAVFEAYTDVLRGRGQEHVQQIGIEQVERQLQRARALFKATLRPEIDVLSAETQLAQARIRLLQARNVTQNAIVALRSAIGAGATAELDPVDRVLGPSPHEAHAPGVLVEEALGARAELRSVELAIRIAGENLRAARADYFPVLSVGANASMIVTDSNFGPTAKLFATFTITEPLFNGLVTRRIVEEQRANLEIARYNLSTLRLGIVQEVESARLAVELASATLAVAEVARRQAERQLALAQARYESKVGSFVELNDARNGMVTAMGSEVDARYALSRSRGQLSRRVGRSVVQGP